MTDYGGSTTPENERDRWVSIPGYEGLYLINPYGEIHSLSHFDSMGRHYPGKTMRPLKNSSGYLAVGLCNKGTKRRFLIHRLVAMTFIGSPPEGYVVNHKNGDKKDNHVSNLEWCSVAENNKHAHKMGLNYISPTNRKITSQRMTSRHSERRKEKQMRIGKIEAA